MNEGMKMKDWMHEGMKIWSNEWVIEWIQKLKNGLRIEWMKEWMDKVMNG